ncbi:YgaP family membrane protein [Ovoidimarina sediminis]|uniref:YgaP family membrane protein n=1 Tax=Ovoidimarina sediminis TaxID=3079856 RepID=UPI00290893FD|nr:DUF2892 domain-containing protein [Rhodophyticola sp. MJ-SS7]MDU8944195.1 DUF2892 domain-containing protein [Rhodophyticola sp. MJ-SS7]
MEENMGTVDRILRLVIGLVLFFTPFLGIPVSWSNTWLAIVSMGLGALLGVTAVFAFCPLYSAFGIRTKGRGRGLRR